MNNIQEIMLKREQLYSKYATKHQTFALTFLETLTELSTQNHTQDTWIKLKYFLLTIMIIYPKE